VFLLQGPGRRRWQISRGGDRTLDPDAAIKVLRRFVPDEEWLLEPGDMLYLPPGVAHWGVAEGPCFTYSIGFLAPSHQDLMQSFLGYLAHALPVSDALVHDADARVPKNSYELNDALIEPVAAILDGIRWQRPLVEDFLGCFLTRPKPHVRFPPNQPLSTEAFARKLRGRGRLTLALPSRGLVRRGRIYLNGEAHRVSRPLSQLFLQLVKTRSLPLPLDEHELFHAWYSAGWLRL
jgi:50S ribosomal protein L16 3-hydroxylase